MAALSISGHFTALAFCVFFFKPLSADPDSSFSFTRFGNDSKIVPKIALYGDAKVVEGGFAVQLTGPGSSRAGVVMYKNPVKVAEGKSGNLVSFSTYFSFSMSPVRGDGFDFLMVPSGFNVSEFDASPLGLSLGSGKSKDKFVAVGFNTLSDGNDGLVKNHVGIVVGTVLTAELSNASASNLASSSENFHAWIDYEAGSKRLEVRVSKDGNSRPSNPLLWHSIDLIKALEEEEVFVGFRSSASNSSMTCFLHSWSFKLRSVPNWMHSEPLDPKAFAKSNKTLKVPNRSDCLSRVLAAMIFGAVCGALAAVTVLYLWTIFGNRRPVVPEEFARPPMDCEYKKVEVLVDKAAIKDGKN